MSWPTALFGAVPSLAPGGAGILDAAGNPAGMAFMCAADSNDYGPRIQAALDAMPAGRKVIVLMGSFNIATPILCDAKTCIYGVSRGGTSLIFAVGDLPGIARRGYANRNVGGQDKINIGHMTIVDNAPLRQNYYAIDMSNCHSCVVEDIEYSIGAGTSRTFTAALSGASSATLSSAWAGTTGIVEITFSDGSTRTATFTNGSAAVSWTGQGVVTATASFTYIAVSDLFGIFFGKALGSSYSGPVFENRLKDSTLSRGSVFMNCGDYYITGNTIWANGRAVAVTVSSGGSISDNQIIPGVVNGGVYCWNESGYDISIMNIQGNYFDGNPQASIYAGPGLKAYAAGALIDSTIVANRFWYTNAQGMLLPKAFNNAIMGNTFRDCDAGDIGMADVKIDESWSNTIIGNAHYRSGTAPKTGATRSTLGADRAVVAKGGGYTADQIANNTKSFNTTYA